jgi:hypothetical protein
VSAERIYQQLTDAQEAQTKRESSAESIYKSLHGDERIKLAEDIKGNDFQPGVYASRGLRWSLARGDTWEEKEKRLKKKYPEGELSTIPQSVMLGLEEDVMIFRESPQTQWKFVEPQGLDAFDIPEALAGSAEAIIGETGMALATRGASFLQTIGAQILAAMGGEAVEQATQSITGVQSQTAGGVSREIGTEGVYSAGGTLIASPMRGAVNIARGAGVLKIGEEGIETFAAANRLEPGFGRHLTPGGVSDHPAIRTAEKQAASVSSIVARYHNTLIKRIDNIVKNMHSPGLIKNAMNDTLDGISAFNRRFLNQLKKLKPTKVGTVRASRSGEALKRGVEEYSRSSHKQVHGLYEAAKKIESPDFDFQPVYDLASDLSKGSKGKLDKKVADQINELRKIKGPIELSPDPVTGEARFLSVTDQIRNVRSELWALKQPDLGSVANRANTQANDLFHAINKMMDNPVNADPLFKEAWAVANKAARERFTTLELAPIVAAAKAQNPIDLVKTYLSPGQAPHLLAIRNTISTRNWRKFTDAAYADLLGDPPNLLKNLDAFDQETLDVFMPRAVQKEFRNIGREFQRIGRLGVEETAELQVTNRNFIDSLMTDATPRNAATINAAQMKGRGNRAWRDSWRAGIVDWAWDGIVIHGKSGLSVNDQLLKNRVKLLKKNGMWDTLGSREQQLLTDIPMVTRAFSSTADAGTAIMGATVTAGVMRVKASAILSMLRYGLVGRFYTSNAGRFILIGTGKMNADPAFLKAFSASLSRMSAPEDISTLQENK